MKTRANPLLDCLLDPLGDILTPDVARKLVRLPFDKKTQAQISNLAR
jgi:hypothetical protein